MTSRRPIFSNLSIVAPSALSFDEVSYCDVDELRARCRRRARSRSGFCTEPVRTTVWFSISTLMFEPAIRRLSSASRPAVSRSMKISMVANCSPVDIEEEGVGFADLACASRNTRLELSTTASTAAGFETMTSRMSRGNSISTDLPRPILMFFFDRRAAGIGDADERLMSARCDVIVPAESAAALPSARPAKPAIPKGDAAARATRMLRAAVLESNPTLLRMIFRLMTTIDVRVLSSRRTHAIWHRNAVLSRHCRVAY